MDHVQKFVLSFVTTLTHRVEVETVQKLLWMDCMLPSTASLGEQTHNGTSSMHAMLHLMVTNTEEVITMLSSKDAPVVSSFPQSLLPLPRSISATN